MFYRGLISTSIRINDGGGSSLLAAEFDRRASLDNGIHYVSVEF